MMVVPASPSVTPGREHRANALFALAGGLMVGLAFPPSPLYTLAYVGFIPLFLLFERMRTIGATVRWFYLAVFVLNLVTLYWTGGFTHMRDPWLMAAGGALLLLHPFFFLPSIVLAHVVRRRLGMVSGVIAFALFWVAFEYVHSLGDLSFPWITIGNSQALDLHRSQIVEWTSVLGLSALVLAFNAAAFILMMKLSSREWAARSRAAVATGCALVLLYAAPWIYGSVRLSQVDAQSGTAFRVGMVQPNVDPWKKWGDATTSKADAFMQELDRHLAATQTFIPRHPDLAIWCETAMPFHLLHPRYGEYRERLARAVDSMHVPVFLGLPTVRYFSKADAPVTANRVEGSDLYAEAYNSAVLASPGGAVGPVYRKMVLVPFGERIPYANALSFLIEPLRWNVGISSWGKGTDQVIHTMVAQRGDSARFGGMICYESLFPNFVRDFTRRGAEFLVVITNDSWWGNTSGAYQHAAIASLRAIENRRWVVQCANGGISIIVRPSGRMECATRMYTETTLEGEIGRLTGETFYVQHGDWLGKLALVSSAGLFVAAILIPMRRKRP